MNKKLLFLTLAVACICTQFFHTTKSEDTASTTAPVEGTETGISMGNGFFGTITNELSSSYYIADSLPISGNGVVTKIGPSISVDSGLGSPAWGDYKFSDLWDTNKTITLAPKDTTLAPTITFTFDDTAKTIKIVVSYDTSISYTYYVNLIAIQNILNNETMLPEIIFPSNIPLPDAWQLDITITSELEIVINQIVTLSAIQLYDFPIGIYKKAKLGDKKSSSEKVTKNSDVGEYISPTGETKSKLDNLKEDYPAPLNTTLIFTPNTTTKQIYTTPQIIKGISPISSMLATDPIEISYYFPLPKSLKQAVQNFNKLKADPSSQLPAVPSELDATLLQNSSMGGLCGLKIVISDQDTNPTCDN